MKKLMFSLFALTLLSFSLEPLTNVKGWFLAGSERESYEIGVVDDAERNGKVGFIKSTKSKIKGFGTIMQDFVPEDFYDQRVKLTAYIKTKDAAGWVGLWMRVDGLPAKDGKNKEVLYFDNMNDRKIVGTTGWTKYEIILDVPKEATNIAYGVLLSGTGEAWLDDIKFEIVDKNEQEATSTKTRLKAPTNTTFEE